MSVRGAMKKAVVEILLANGWVKDAIAIVGSPGKPRPNCGSHFLAVWGAPRQWISHNSAYVTLALNLTLTMRIDGAPMDRWDSRLNDEEEGFDNQIDLLCSLLYREQNRIRERADQLMPSSVENFITAPCPISDEEPSPVGADWFNAEPGPAIGDGLVYGFRSNILYGHWSFQHPAITAAL